MDDQAIAAIAARAQEALPDRRIVAMRRWPGGLTNAVFRLTFETGPDAALRVYPGGPNAARTDVDLHRALGGRIPVPDVLAADVETAPAWAIFRWIEGPTLRSLRSGGDPAALAAAGAGIGAVLARLAGFRPAAATGTDSAAAILAANEAAEQAGALAPALAERVRQHVRKVRDRLAEADAGPVLVHGDFSARNIILDGVERPAVAAIVDWERATTGSALIDLGSVLRYERPERALLEPHLSNAYRSAGGVLPARWRDLARTYDLIDALRGFGSATLSPDARAELLAIVAGTVSAP
jgi:aminoglycoside phosphotransferase (APT) family kinase protein